jgi:S1-C subfamily serine protease
MVRFGPVLMALALAAASPQDGPDKLHVAVYKKVAPATVFVSGGGQSGSGVVVDPSGVILTSPTACGTATRTVKVILPGARQYRGKVMGRVNEKELVLVKIDARDLPCVEFGDSVAVKVGQISYVLGDSFQSIQNDGQPAISLGVVSAVYELGKKQRGTYYTGKVIETSAAVNPNQDGGPLVDRRGRLLGIVTLNYDDSKFTGAAIPIGELREDIERIRREYETGPVAASAGGEEAWFGAELKAGPGGLEVARLARKGPAERAGLQRGDVLTRVESDDVRTDEEFRTEIGRRSAGETLRVTVLRDGVPRELTVTLGRRPAY